MPHAQPEAPAFDVKAALERMWRLPSADSAEPPALPARLDQLPELPEPARTLPFPRLSSPAAGPRARRRKGGAG